MEDEKSWKTRSFGRREDVDDDAGEDVGKGRRCGKGEKRKKRKKVWETLFI